MLEQTPVNNKLPILEWLMLIPNCITSNAIAFCLGVLSGVFANTIYDKIKMRKYKNTGYCNTEVSGGFILINSKIKNTETSQKVVSTLIKHTEQ